MRLAYFAKLVSNKHYNDKELNILSVIYSMALVIVRKPRNCDVGHVRLTSAFPLTSVPNNLLGIHSCKSFFYFHFVRFFNYDFITHTHLLFTKTKIKYIVPQPLAAACNQ